jgi:predicted double-glycine peptidase
MKKPTVVCGVLLAFIAFYGCAAQTPLSNVTVMPLKAGGVRSDHSLLSWKELRDRNVVIQRFDYSCGAGALATLMRYYFGDKVEEEEILLSIIRPMTGEELRDREKNGLSLLDLKRCAEQKGYQAAGVMLKYASLPKLKGPVLVHLEREDYKHFAILKGVRGDRVYLADPSLGNIRISADRFAREWSGIALVLGKSGFGLPQKYPLALDDQEPIQNELLDARKSIYVQ